MQNFIVLEPFAEYTVGQLIQISDTDLSTWSKLYQGKFGPEPTPKVETKNGK